MNAEELTSILKSRYEAAENKEVVLSIHLFGIEFGNELEGHALNDIAEAATGHRSYGTELRKGLRLSNYVELKTA